MLNISRINSVGRMQEVRIFLSAIKEQESTSTPPTDSDVVKIMRGLFFVHLYGAFEKSINEAMEEYLQAIDSLQLCFNHLDSSFLPTAMDARFKSLQSSSMGFGPRVDFIKILISSDVCKINNTIFAMLLQNTPSRTRRNVYSDKVTTDLTCVLFHPRTIKGLMFISSQ